MSIGTIANLTRPPKTSPCFKLVIWLKLDRNRRSCHANKALYVRLQRESTRLLYSTLTRLFIYKYLFDWVSFYNLWIIIKCKIMPKLGQIPMQINTQENCLDLPPSIWLDILPTSSRVGWQPLQPAIPGKVEKRCGPQGQPIGNLSAPYGEGLLHFWS